MSWAKERKEDGAITLTHGWEMNLETIQVCNLIVISVLINSKIV